jgi:hypothetical protein
MPSILAVRFLMLRKRPRRVILKCYSLEESFQSGGKRSTDDTHCAIGDRFLYVYSHYFVCWLEHLQTAILCDIYIQLDPTHHVEEVLIFAVNDHDTGNFKAGVPQQYCISMERPSL